jgi:sec-independent protein translocase protein TatB
VGFSLGEIFLLILVGIIVVGPKRLPGMMRTAGQWVARLRRMSMDLRSQSGIDDILRQEGLDQHLHELRSLSRLNVVETLMAPRAAPLDTPAPRLDQPSSASGGAAPRPRALPRSWRTDEPLREREYPLLGCDAYGALPDDAAAYLPPAATEAITPDTTQDTTEATTAVTTDTPAPAGQS